MAGIEAAEGVQDLVKRFVKATNKNRFICLVIGKDEDGLEEIQLLKDEDSGHDRDHLGGHWKPKKGPSLLDEAKEHDIEEAKELDDESSHAERFPVIWKLMQAKIKQNKKKGKFFFIKVPYEKGGAVSEGVCFVLYAGTNKKQKMIYSMTSRTVKEWVSIKTTFEDPLNTAPEEAVAKLADFV